MDRLEHSEEDLARVQLQLGREPRGSWAVARRCHLGIPMVIESHPRLDDGSPFPTLFWLTCPLLVKRTGHLESRGDMAKLTERLGADDSLRSRLSNALDRYNARRDARAPLEGAAQPGGGPERVKCLHAHLAHELADPPNPIGSLALATVGSPDCRMPCVTPDSVTR